MLVTLKIEVLFCLVPRYCIPPRYGYMLEQLTKMIFPSVSKWYKNIFYIKPKIKVSFLVIFF